MTVAGVVVNPSGIRPIGLGRHNIEALGINQLPRDPRAHTVEFRSCVSRFTDQHHACIPNSMEERSQVDIVQFDESFGVFRN